jgi:hypothetical protein
MHRSRQVALALALIGCTACGDAESRYNTDLGPSTAGPGTSDLLGSPLFDRFRPCSAGAENQCLEDESCIQGSTEPFNICLASCNDVNDCIAPSEPITEQPTPSLTCSEFEGTKRCIMSCTDASECGAGMICTQGACVFP